MIQHYEGELGVFDYDDEEFEVGENEFELECLFYIGKGSSVNLPKGCINTRSMFSRCYGFLPEDFTLGDNFDTSNVEDMSFMFLECSLPEGFSLGDKFDTSNVKDMSFMFRTCYLPKNFSLGDKFNTSNVINMCGMFEYFRLPEGFSLGDKFDTSNVKDMSRVFHGIWFPKGFSLGNKFDTSNATDVSEMFCECVLPEGFSLGDKFDTSSVEDMRWMFSDSELPEGFSLGDKFNTSNVKTMEKMFENCLYNGKALKDTPEEIINFLKNNNTKLIECQKALLKLLKEGKTLKEAEEILSNDNLVQQYTDIIGNLPSMPISVIELSSKKIKVELSEKCTSVIPSMLGIIKSKKM